MAQGIILHRNRNVNTTKIYGISRDITNSSPLWTRTDNAVGLTATASIGTTAGISSFNNIYPWKDIVRETLPSGDVMVKIPKFYYRRYVELNIEYIKITDKAADGFTLHPLFNRIDGVKDYVYVGAYTTSVPSSAHMSVSGQQPKISLTMSGFRNKAISKGTGWNLVDIAALSAIQMLILIEFATNNVQNSIGMGYSDTNNSNKINTGSCDNIINLTGIATASNSGTTGVAWRGIEDFWGNVAEYVDGLKWNSGTYYVCNDPSLYNSDINSTNYTSLSYVGQTNWSSSYIVVEGIDPDNTHIMLPSVAGGTGSGSGYFCDSCYSGTGWRIFEHGGKYNYGNQSGLFAAYFTGPSGYSSFTGSRLMYIPPN